MSAAVHRTEGEKNSELTNDDGTTSGVRASLTNDVANDRTTAVDRGATDMLIRRSSESLLLLVFGRLGGRSGGSRGAGGTVGASDVERESEVEVRTIGGGADFVQGGANPLRLVCKGREKVSLAFHKTKRSSKLIKTSGRKENVPRWWIAQTRCTLVAAATPSSAFLQTEAKTEAT